MVELDAKRFGARIVDTSQDLTLSQLTRRYGFHFLSLVSIIVFMLLGLFADARGVLVDRADLRLELSSPAKPR
jgi:hypothetical protein